MDMTIDIYKMENSFNTYKEVPKILCESLIYFSKSQLPIWKSLFPEVDSSFLPCWVPYKIYIARKYGEDNDIVSRVESHYNGYFLWATEFSNVQQNFIYKQPSIVIDSVKYNSVEHYFQLMKSKDTPDHEIAKMQMKHASPMECYNIGRKYAMVKNWYTLKKDVMYSALFAKFTQNPELYDLLISTKNHYLVSIKIHDDYWGTGNYGKGKNVLGKMLMNIRSEIIH